MAIASWKREAYAPEGLVGTVRDPARSTGPALVMGGQALAQLWLFWVAPLIGAVLAGLVGRWLNAEKA